MPDLAFRVTGVEAAARGLVPLLVFKVRITNLSQAQPVQSVILHAQIQLQPAGRAYQAKEKQRLTDLFGPPERWGQTLRNRLWTFAHATVGPFEGSTETGLPVQCSYDLNLTATKYFYALDADEVSLLFLFSGTVFYTAAEGRLQVEQISWNQECPYRFPVRVWRELMEQHYPNSAWFYVRRDVFDRLYDYKRREGLATWEQVIEQLLPAPEPEEVAS